MTQSSYEVVKTLSSEISRQDTAIKTLTNDVRHEVPQKRDKKHTLFQLPFLDSSIVFAYRSNFFIETLVIIAVLYCLGFVALRVLRRSLVS